MTSPSQTRSGKEKLFLRSRTGFWHKVVRSGDNYKTACTMLVVYGAAVDHMPEGAELCPRCQRHDIPKRGKSAKHPLYELWKCMKDRCRRPKYVGYKLYGGAGIKVCERWANSFATFVEDMGPKPTPQHQIDRIDPNGDYCPENCRWATPKENTRNRRMTVFLEFDGKRLALTEWAERVGIRACTIRGRLRSGWPVERALKTHP